LDNIPTSALVFIWVALIVVGVVLVFTTFLDPGARPSTPTSASVAQATPTPGPAAPAAQDTVAPQPQPTQDLSAQPAPVEPTSAPAPDAPQPTLAPLLDPGMEYGIQSNAITGPMDQTIKLARDRMYLGWIKQQVRWGDFSPAPGQMDWSGFDHFVEEASKADMRVLFSIVTAPKWARAGLDNVDGPPDDLNVFAQFVGEVVDRYRGKVQAIEIWNEQNIDSEWKVNPQAVSPERYVEMLRLAYQTIKSKDPQVMVISGALSPTGFFGGGCSAAGCDDQPYLRRMMELGFLQYADCIGVHVNGFNLPPEYRHDAGYNDPSASFRGPFNNPHPSWSFRSTLEDYRAITQNQKPLCVTEFGWASYEGISTTALASYEYGLDNTAEEQAQWDAQAFRLMRDWSYVKLAILFNLDFAQKSPQGASDRTAPWSVTDLTGAERPAVREVRRFMKEVLGIP
jgi:hypothetical protein